MQTSQTNFSTNQLLHKPHFALTNFYKPAFTQISFDTNQFLHKTTYLDKPPFTQTTTFISTSFTQPLL